MYRLDLETNELRDLTPYVGVKAKVIALSNKDFPHEMIILLNKENPKLFDAYHVNIQTGELTLVAKNPGTVTNWFADKQFQVRGALATNTDGSQQLLIRNDNNDSWRLLLQVDFEDTLIDELHTGALGFSADGKHFYLNSSHLSVTRSLLKMDVESGACICLASDNQYDIDYVIFNEKSSEPEIVCWQKERMEYLILNNELKNDFNTMQAISDGALQVEQVTSDQSKWVLGFMHDNKSYEYYVFDRQSKQKTFLFYKQDANLKSKQMLQ